VVGSGPDLERLTALRTSLGLGDAVQFVGFLPHDEAVEEMAKAEVFILLSRMRDERLPNVVKEGMACGCVCVTTPTPGVDELVRHGVDGFVVSMDDAGPAFEAIDSVFAGRVDAVAMTAAAATHIREEFDVDRTAPRYLTLWREALKRRGPT
ncbi:MAG: glycosyltransferase, partial [Thioalkalivibrio sp.]|nr:glycosyltransferase [Thioalkalivibrio sp.]